MGVVLSSLYQLVNGRLNIHMDGGIWGRKEGKKL